MGWWFGRKAAPPARPFAPVWLQGEGEAGGFVRGFEGMQLLDKSSGQLLTYRSATWEVGILRCQRIDVDGDKVLGAHQPAIAGPDGGVVIDAECRAAVASVLAALASHGLIGQA
jgi:hypothetical protein